MARLFTFWFPPKSKPPSLDTRLILAALAQQETTLSKVTDALKRLSDVDVTLAAEIDEILANLAGEPKAIADAVSAALTAAQTNNGSDDEVTAAAVDAATAASQALVDKIKGVLTPTPRPVETDTTTAVDDGPATLQGGAGDDSLG